MLKHWEKNMGLRLEWEISNGCRLIPWNIKKRIFLVLNFDLRITSVVNIMQIRYVFGISINHTHLQEIFLINCSYSEKILNISKVGI